MDINPQDGWQWLRAHNHNWLGIVADSGADAVLEHFGRLDVKFDFIFIDGDHSYAGALRDFVNYSKFLADDGIVAFHDIIDSKYHHDNYCFVDRLWSEIWGFGFDCEEFVFDGIGYTGQFKASASPANWGGIGIVTNAAPVHGVIGKFLNSLDSQIHGGHA